jgi:hypothetical protein
MLVHVAEFFHAFTMVEDYQKIQQRMLARSREELNSESLRFGFRVYPLEFQREYVRKVISLSLLIQSIVIHFSSMNS